MDDLFVEIDGRLVAKSFLKYKNLDVEGYRQYIKQQQEEFKKRAENLKEQEARRTAGLPLHDYKITANEFLTEYKKAFGKKAMPEGEVYEYFINDKHYFLDADEMVDFLDDNEELSNKFDFYDISCDCIPDWYMQLKGAFHAKPDWENRIPGEWDC